MKRTTNGLAGESLLFGQLLAHQPMQQVERLERADHHLEMHDQTAVTAKGDDVDTVDPGPFDFLLELQHRTVVAQPFADVFETGSAQYLFRARQILEGDLASSLRRV